jgi:hypothetical protein
MRFGVGVGGALGLALLLAPAARAADREAIQRAVGRGVAYLKGLQGQDGTWRYADPNVAGDAPAGATALCGLALLEGGVSAEDRAVQKAAKAVREQSVTLTRTYPLSLAIMFLDRLGDPADAELIDSLAIRLLAGQDARLGGWTYDCPPLADAEVRRLQASLQQRSELVARSGPPQTPERRPNVQDLPREIQQQLQLINQQQGAAALRPAGDNSNTQFAILALWIARRKGIPVEAALQRIDNRFRTTQAADGAWLYQLGGPLAGRDPMAAKMEMMMREHAGPSYSVPAMTCAGLLGLALAQGSSLEVTLRANVGGTTARRQPADLSKDPVIRNALLSLGKSLGKLLDQANARPNGPGGLAPGGPPVAPARAGGGDVYYFLFSLERMAVAYGLETLGDKDWYQWGADTLLAAQNQDGGWSGQFAEGGADTCFAILFLQRANLAKDLSATLKGQVKDPARRELRAVDVENAGSSGSAPRETRPAPAATDPEVARLSDELVQADAGRQETVLQKLRESKGAVYTDALAHAIHRLDGEAKGKARDALADRLARMKAATLADKLRDDDAEVRRAAALACAIKDERDNVPRLIELLGDHEPTVARSARAALKSLAGQDLGPEPAPWKDWWAKNGGR